MRVSALLIEKEDMQKRSFLDWLVSHTAGFLPPHRYKGMLDITDAFLKFEGIDSRTSEETELIFPKATITEVYHGYDKIYSIFQTRGLGLTWAPVRLKIEERPDISRWFYLIAGYDTLNTLNRDFYTYLTIWLS
jgi:hypothetical protein